MLSFWFTVKFPLSSCMTAPIADKIIAFTDRTTKSEKMFSSRPILHHSGVARTFPGERGAHPESQNEDKIEESLRKNKK